MFALSRDYRMTLNEPKTDDDWLQFELDVGRLFSAAPLSPVGSPDYVPGGLARIIREAPGLAAWRGLIGIVFVASMTR